jgi:type III secretion system (T3SS) SseB-like protein
VAQGSASPASRGGARFAGRAHFQGSADTRFRGDDGTADPTAAAALAAFAAAEGTEHAALTALSGTRLLVPVVARLAQAGEPGPGEAGPEGADQGHADSYGNDPGGVERDGSGLGGGEKDSEMVLPTIVGRDGRPAIPVFTSLAALARWQPSARPIPADAAQVWQAAVADSCAVIVDIAGPVPLAVEGARLTALAQGRPVPQPHEDPDVHAAVAAAVAGVAPAQAAALPAAAFVLGPGLEGADLMIELALPPGLDAAAAQDLVTRVGSSALARLGTRLPRGLSIAIAS